MLIVCPSCATSYMIDPAAVGPAGRMVRCARCKATWFAGGPKSAPDVTAFVDGVIAEAEAQSPPPARTEAPPRPLRPRHRRSPRKRADDFGAEDRRIDRRDRARKAPPVEPRRRTLRVRGAGRGADAGAAAGHDRRCAVAGAADRA